MPKYKKDMKQLINKVKKTPGWEVEWSGTTHYRVTPPEGSPLFVPGTPSSWWTIANTKARLKRAGWQVSA